MALCLGVGPLAASEPYREVTAKEIFGYVERITLSAEPFDEPFELEAKLDTGADTSSLDATRIRRFRRSGKSYVEFTVTDPQSGERTTVKLPRLRSARIKRHEGTSQTRPVVSLEICLGGHRREVEFSLIDRSEFLYPVLLGRQALEGIAVVDPALTFTRDPRCQFLEGE